MEEQNLLNPPRLSRISILRPLWWILQTIIIGIWEIVLTVVLVWQFFHVLVMGKRHEWSSEFTRKYANHVIAWIEYTFWVRDDRPRIIEY